MVLSPSTQTLCAFLAGVACDMDARKQRQWLSEIEKKRRMAQSSQISISPDLLSRLNQSRASISRSLLRCPQAIKKWHDGNTLIHDWLLQDKSFTLEDLIHLNAVLSSTEKPLFRDCNIYTFGVKHVEVCEIKIIMQEFLKYLNSQIQNNNALYAAFICRYWILSIHPFADANGRSSQLLADYFLLKHGYPSQAFMSTVEALIIGHPVYRPYMNPHRAFKRFTQTVLNAYEILRLG